MVVGYLSLLFFGKKLTLTILEFVTEVIFFNNFNDNYLFIFLMHNNYSKFKIHFKLHQGKILKPAQKIVVEFSNSKIRYLNLNGLNHLKI